MFYKKGFLPIDCSQNKHVVASAYKVEHSYNTMAVNINT